MPGSDDEILSSDSDFSDYEDALPEYSKIIEAFDRFDNTNETPIAKADIVEVMEELDINAIDMSAIDCESNLKLVKPFVRVALTKDTKNQEEQDKIDAFINKLYAQMIQEHAAMLAANQQAGLAQSNVGHPPEGQPDGFKAGDSKATLATPSLLQSLQQQGRLDATGTFVKDLGKQNVYSVKINPKTDDLTVTFTKNATAEDKEEAFANMIKCRLDNAPNDTYLTYDGKDTEYFKKAFEEVKSDPKYANHPVFKNSSSAVHYSQQAMQAEEKNKKPQLDSSFLNMLGKQG